MAPIAGLQIKGAIFHQGYNNCFNGSQGAVMYRQVFPEMIRAWRAAFDDDELPFGILSLCTEGAVQTLEAFQPLIAMQGDRHGAYRLELYQQLLEAVATHRVAGRPDRFEPRQRKRRQKKYDRMMKPRNVLKRQMLKRLN